MKYSYNSSLECFERRDAKGVPRGRKLWVNIDEARRIVTLYDLGNSIGVIKSKMQFNNPKASAYTVNTVVSLYENNEIELSGDFPAPSQVFDDLSVDARISQLEHEIEELKSCKCNEVSSANTGSFVDKIRGLFK